MPIIAIMAPRLAVLLAALAPPAAAMKVEWTQTARAGETLTLLQDKPPLTLRKAGEAGPMPPAVISVDRGTQHQEFAGFGGAFTEASAINWRKLSDEDQAALIHLYFGDPADGGLGYTMGRVPINSCDFSPATYTFDDTEGDVELDHFDNSVQVRSPRPPENSIPISVSDFRPIVLPSSYSRQPQDAAHTHQPPHRRRPAPHALVPPVPLLLVPDVRNPSLAPAPLRPFAPPFS